MPFCIREFDRTDFDTLWRIDQACFDPQLAYSRPELAFYMRRPGSFTLVAQSVDESGRVPSEVPSEVPINFPSKVPGNIPGSGILGFIVAEIRRNSGHIITIDVVQKARRTGIGSALLEAAEKRLVEAGAVTVALETPVNNAAAIRFYKHQGYFVERTATGYYSNQMDALVMVKELKRPVVR